jgi:hypothetical protein
VKLVPFAIDEAERLYGKHMYISLSLWQMWRTREDCMTAESGLEHLPGTEGEFQSSTFISNVSLYKAAFPSNSLIRLTSHRTQKLQNLFQILHC